MYVCIHTRTCIYTHTLVYTYIYTCIYIACKMACGAGGGSIYTLVWMYAHAHTHLCHSTEQRVVLCINLHVYMCVCVYIYIYTYIYIYVHAIVHIYIHTLVYVVQTVQNGGGAFCGAKGCSMYKLVCMYINIHKHKHTHTFVYAYIHIHTYTCKCCTDRAKWRRSVLRCRGLVLQAMNVDDDVLLRFS